jgi:hypothetical protein
LHLNLPLQVFAVILSAAKNPEELNAPHPLDLFTRTLSRALFACPFIDKAKEHIHNNKVQLK